MSVTYPRGFRASSITAGFKPSRAPDLGLLVGAPGTTAAGLFTTNLAAAAPVRLSRTRLKSAGARAVIVNSGQANAATGHRGEEDALAATAAAADAVGLPHSEMLQCSTGVIGEPLHMPQLLAALPELAERLDPQGGDGFARAILTTDTVDKCATAEVADLRVGGCAKGVGMIAPSLATMLAFVTTDAKVSTADLRRLAEEQLRPRFNSLTVDACMSTNDTVLLFASGAAGDRPQAPGSSGWEPLSEAIASVGESLVRQLITDAEGGNHVLVIGVEGAATDEEARRIAKAVAESPLVKTAAFGGDPNPGRILQAVGSCGADIDPALVDVAIGGVRVASAGVIPPEYFDGGDLAGAARAQMKDDEITVAIRVGHGRGTARTFGCDLSHEYVRINGEYTT